jgi:hypothetical protein
VGIPGDKLGIAEQLLPHRVETARATRPQRHALPVLVEIGLRLFTEHEVSLWGEQHGSEDTTISA